VNASPLIFLTEIGLLEVLRQPGVPVLVPDVVLAEVSRLGPNDPAIQAVQCSPWIRVAPTPAIPDAVLVWDLDAGESAVLAVALEQPDSMAILDDQPARRCAQVLNIQTQGTLGLVLLGSGSGDTGSKTRKKDPSSPWTAAKFFIPQKVRTGTSRARSIREGEGD